MPLHSRKKHDNAFPTCIFVHYRQAGCAETYASSPYHCKFRRLFNKIALSSEFQTSTALHTPAFLFSRRSRPPWSCHAGCLGHLRICTRAESPPPGVALSHITIRIPRQCPGHRPKCLLTGGTRCPRAKTRVFLLRLFRGRFPAHSDVR
jgi:hypothetical protein